MSKLIANLLQIAVLAADPTQQQLGFRKPCSAPGLAGREGGREGGGEGRHSAHSGSMSSVMYCPALAKLQQNSLVRKVKKVWLAWQAWQEKV
jgi:hypothetical protein